MNGWRGVAVGFVTGEGSPPRRASIACALTGIAGRTGASSGSGVGEGGGRSAVSADGLGALDPHELHLRARSGRSAFRRARPARFLWPTSFSVASSIEGLTHHGQACGDIQASGRFERERAGAAACGVAAIEERDGSELQSPVLESRHVHDGGEIDGLVEPRLSPVKSMR